MTMNITLIPQCIRTAVNACGDSKLLDICIMGFISLQLKAVT